MSVAVEIESETTSLLGWPASSPRLGIAIFAIIHPYPLAAACTPPPLSLHRLSTGKSTQHGRQPQLIPCPSPVPSLCISFVRSQAVPSPVALREYAQHQLAQRALTRMPSQPQCPCIIPLSRHLPLSPPCIHSAQLVYIKKFSAFCVLFTFTLFVGCYSRFCTITGYALPPHASQCYHGLWPIPP